jgi:hypothetical protein
MSVFHRLEIDVMQANELGESVELAIKYQIPAIVVHPGLASDALRARGRSGGRFKIITPVDWPKGDSYGSIKFRGLSTDAIEADGFEIYLTGGKTQGETQQEARQLTDFIKRQLSEMTEVRFVLGALSRDEPVVDTLINGLIGVRTPTLVRTDPQLKLQVSKANTDIHNALIKRIRSVVRIPVKVSGNIAGVRAVTGVPDAVRLAVSLLQAKAIIKEFNQQPGELKTLLDEPAKGNNGDPAAL